MTSPLVREIDNIIQRTKDVIFRRGTVANSTQVNTHGGTPVKVNDWVDYPGVGEAALLLQTNGGVVGLGLNRPQSSGPVAGTIHSFHYSGIGTGTATPTSTVTHTVDAGFSHTFTDLPVGGKCIILANGAVDGNTSTRSRYLEIINESGASGATRTYHRSRTEEDGGHSIFATFTTTASSSQWKFQVRFLGGSVMTAMGCQDMTMQLIAFNP